MGIEWTIFITLGTIIGSFAVVAKPLLNLQHSITSLQTSIDACKEKLDKYENKTDDQEKRLNDHETRIKLLEEKVSETKAIATKNAETLAKKS